jgi:hypothetical protein
VIALLDVARQLLADVLRFAIVALRPTRVVAAENLFLRWQLAMYIERGVKPRRPDVATRVSLALLSSLFDWRCTPQKLDQHRPDCVERREPCHHRRMIVRGFCVSRLDTVLHGAAKDATGVLVSH